MSTREELVEAVASAIHAYVCPCRGADQAPMYYQGAARAALVVIDKARNQVARAVGVHPNMAEEMVMLRAEEVASNMLRTSDEWR